MVTEEKLLDHLNNLKRLEEKAVAIYKGLIDGLEEGGIKKELVKIELEEEEHIRLITEVEKIFREI